MQRIIITFHKARTVPEYIHTRDASTSFELQPWISHTKRSIGDRKQSKSNPDTIDI